MATRVFTFDRVSVTVTPSNHKLIQWYVNPHYQFNTVNVVFYVEYAWAVDGDWERINPLNPTTDCMYVDMDSYRCSLADNLYYRVVADDTVEEHTSKPAHTLGGLTNRNYRLMKDVLRKEYLRLKKYINLKGYLLKRKRHGEICTDCTDYDTGDVVNSSCPNCYGTKYVGGYYDAVEYYVDLTGTLSEKDVQIPLGEIDNRNRSARAVAYPQVETYDLWVDADKNKRYVIRKVQSAVEFEGVPAVYTLEFRELQPTAIEFDVPLIQNPITGSSSSHNCSASSSSTSTGSLGSSSSALLADNGWRTGISFQDF
jgi:hypothetical protein